jgi:hypothetical protein
MQLRGLACWSGSLSGLLGSSGIVGSSRSALLLRLSATAVLSGMVASRWRAISRCASDWLSLTCSASAKRTWEVRNASSASRAPALLALAAADAHGQETADDRKQAADEQRHPHRHQGRRALLLVAVELEPLLVVGVRDREGVEQAGAVQLVALGHAVGGELALRQALPLAVGGALARDRRELGLVVGRDVLRVAQQRLHAGALADVVLDRLLGAGVEPAVERAVAVQEAREQLLRGLRLRVGGRRRVALGLRGEQHRSSDTEDAERNE